MAKAPTAEAEITVIPLRTGQGVFGIVGKSPLIFNAMSEKARRELLLPSRKRTAAERAGRLKHNPIEEFRNSVYCRIGGIGPTRLTMPATSFKGAMMTAALDLPGTRKSEIGRLAWVRGTYVDIYGVPQLLMSVVRSADINKTPDIRTRAIVPRWCCVVHIEFVEPKLNADTIGALIGAGGLLAGIGDFRQEKGRGSFGQFRMASQDDAEFLEIVKSGDMKAQDEALANPVCYDAESEELMSWFQTELKTLHFKKPSNDIDEGKEAAD